MLDRPESTTQQVVDSNWLPKTYGSYTIDNINFVNKTPNPNITYFNIGDKVMVLHQIASKTRVSTQQRKGKSTYEYAWYPGFVTKLIPKGKKMSYEIFFPDEADRDNPYGVITHGKDIKPCPLDDVQDTETDVDPAFAEILLDEKLDTLRYSDDSNNSSQCELSQQQKRSIVEEYHNSTGLRSQSLLHMLRTVGQYKWPDLQQIVNEVEKD